MMALKMEIRDLEHPDLSIGNATERKNLPEVGRIQKPKGELPMGLVLVYEHTECLDLE